MKSNDLISRAAAIDALTDKNIEMNFDSVYDGEIHRTKRAVIRIVANLPTVDATPVEWLKARIRSYTGDINDIGKSVRNGTIKNLIREWQKEQEAR